jgi:choline dehydrogenase-like flavoprotein
MVGRIHRQRWQLLIFGPRPNDIRSEYRVPSVKPFSISPRRTQQRAARTGQANNFFSSPNDMPRLVAGFRRAREVGEQSAMAPYRGVEASPGPSCRTDADIEAFITRTTITAHRPCATCRMGSDARAPLDPALRLRGIDGLRVADASAMPDIITAHINACVLMIGEKAADLIRADA